MVDTAKAKLVTIILGSELMDRLTQTLAELGATGYTSVAVSGRGLHGRRTQNTFDSGNIRFETIVSPSIAEKILEHVESKYVGFEVVAFAHDVDAVPKAHFS
jgi:nitrogen regulatory protein P-II 2